MPREGPAATGRVAKWTQDDFNAHIGFMMQFNQELKDAGQLVGAEGLANRR